MIKDLQLKPLADIAAEKMVDLAIDDPLKAMEGMDTLLSLAAKFIPTTPEQSPFPMPLGIYNMIAKGDK